MNVPKDISEVENLRENLYWLQKSLPIALKNWQNTKPDCNYYFKIMREICEKPGKINDLIFDPLLKWLADYQLMREGRLAVAGKGGLDIFLKNGIKKIYHFIVVADFFSKNTDYFVPGYDKTSRDKQKEYKEFLNILSSKLIGCNKDLGFIFLSLTTTIKEISDELKPMRKYLEDYCVELRIEKLKN